MHQAHHFETQITRKLDYLLYLPKDYGNSEAGAKLWPLILFLHGMGERGNGGEELERVKKHGIARIVDEQPDFPFIAVSPQCPSTSWWAFETEALKALLDSILAKYAVDPDRVYLTGLSMGGYGAWALGIQHPDVFAAVAPICGGGEPEKVCALKNVPVWAFHGDADMAVQISESVKMVEALQACGGDVKFTVYPGVEHDSWTQT
ncbi:MAG: prolyl oligopeptidase family serine peptidase, partial [Anaerolineae bacterium]|nr:prolyl oligopeptidase family serine peptidase [Anaerolineae bacterium]